MPQYKVEAVRANQPRCSGEAIMATMAIIGGSNRLKREQERRERKNARQRIYEKTDAGRATHRKYTSSPKARQVRNEWNKGPVYKAIKKRYRATDGGKIMSKLLERAWHTKLARKLHRQEKMTPLRGW